MKNNKGFTLIESVITFAILAIAGLMLMSLTSNVIHLMKESAFIKNETDQKYANVQIGMNVDINENAEVTLVLDDNQEPIKSVVKGTKTQKEATDNFDFQLSKMIVDSDWIDEAPDVPPVDPDEWLDATFVLLKDIQDNNGLVDNFDTSKFFAVTDGIEKQDALNYTFGKEFRTVYDLDALIPEQYLQNMPNGNEFLVDPYLGLFEPTYRQNLINSFQDAIEQDISVPIKWVGIDNTGDKPIVYGVIVPIEVEDKIGIIIDGVPTIVEKDMVHNKLQPPQDLFALYCDGELMGIYPGRDKFWKQGFFGHIPTGTKLIEIVNVSKKSDSIINEKGGENMKNKKGFTLVEIIVAIAIGSIVLMVAGSMMVSSFKFMFSTTDTDMNKLMTDNVIDLVRSEVEFSYNVRLMNSTDDEAPVIGEESQWHCYYVKDGMLYRDEQPVLNEGYYEGKKLELLAKGNFENGVRVDFTYHLFNTNGEKIYGARDTILFLNVHVPDEILEKGLYDGEAEIPLTENGYRLYFNNNYNER